MPQTARTTELIEQARDLKMSAGSRRKNRVSLVVGLSDNLTRTQVIELAPELAP